MKPYLITSLNIENQSISRKAIRAKNIKKARDSVTLSEDMKQFLKERKVQYPWKVLSVEPVKKKGDAVIYARVSTRKQSYGYSFERQITVTSDWAFDNGYKVVKVFKEIGSAFRDTHKLKQRDEAVDICLKKDIPLLVEDLDRWSRAMEFPSCRIISTGVYKTGQDDPIKDSQDYCFKDTIFKYLND